MRKIYSSLDEAVRNLYGNERSVARRRRITGGDINEACALALDDGTTLFMKYNSPDAFLNLEAEAIGLTEIAATRTIGAAKLLGLGKDRNCSFLLLEFIADSPPCTKPPSPTRRLAMVSIWIILSACGSR